MRTTIIVQLLATLLRMVESNRLSGGCMKSTNCRIHFLKIGPHPAIIERTS